MDKGTLEELTKEWLYEAADRIKKYCGRQDYCDKCPFFSGNPAYPCGIEHNIPADWDLV